MRTKITVFLGVLRIVVLDPDGSINMDDSLDLICQAEDVNGNLIKSPDCHAHANDSFGYPQTDREVLYSTSPEGYRYFYVGSGPYLLHYSTCILASDITVSPQEIKDIQVPSYDAKCR